jgi:PleD family two-component response regulator
VHHVLGRLREVNVDCDGHLIALSFSAGWTDFKPGESTADLLKRADDALYVNKRTSRIHEVVEVLKN